MWYPVLDLGITSTEYEQFGMWINRSIYPTIFSLNISMKPPPGILQNSVPNKVSKLLPKER